MFKGSGIGLSLSFILLLCYAPIYVSEQSFSSDFIENYQRLQTPNLQLSWVGMLNEMGSEKEQLAKLAFVKRYREAIKSLDVETMDEMEERNIRIMLYEIELLEQQAQLRLEWLNNSYQIPQNEALRDTPMGKEWYAYFLKRWVDIDAKPEEIFELGLKSLNLAKKEMTGLQLQSGLSKEDFKAELQSSRFQIKDVHHSKKHLLQIQEKVHQGLSVYFPFANKIPLVQIERGENQALAFVPAYYDGIGTFYFNQFEEPLNARALPWTFLHEGSPGHHYQNMVLRQLELSELQQHFGYIGYMEGWAAYIEAYGKALGVYETIWDEYGRWEWDIVRSARLCIDVGLNYYDWSDEQAQRFWKKHIDGQEGIMQREIDRMKRAPAQVVTYKYGQAKMEQWKEALVSKSPKCLKKFHEALLQNGTLPFQLLEKEMQNYILAVNKPDYVE